MPGGLLLAAGLVASHPWPAPEEDRPPAHFNGCVEGRIQSGVTCYADSLFCPTIKTCRSPVFSFAAGHPIKFTTCHWKADWKLKLSEGWFVYCSESTAWIIQKLQPDSVSFSPFLWLGTSYVAVTFLRSRTVRYSKPLQWIRKGCIDFTYTLGIPISVVKQASLGPVWM